MDTLIAPVATTPNGQHPGVLFARRYVWVDYPPAEPAVDDADESGWRPNPDYLGFRALILANPVGADELAERDARLALLKRELTEDAYLAAIAWRVKAWNALGQDEAGTIVPIPAPGEAPDNWPAFRAIPSDLLGWLCQQVRTIHLPKRPMTTSAPAGTTAGSPRDTPPPPDTE